MSEYTLGPTSTVYVDGSAIYDVRLKGFVGIVDTLRLFADDYARLINLGVFSEYGR